ncbi:hypothetical protein [Providencia sp. PROV255]|uniref:hypothetical protein n=1 Tax=Providencia sp. PROV255 TaxID=2949943 RepID=UPI002349478A|nr:hypothetical protein [Providencia sp. PROV255]
MNKIFIEVHSTEVYKTKDIIDDIYKQAEALDIILFGNNKNSFTSRVIKAGTLSGFNHAALVMDAPPDIKNDASSGNEQTTSNESKYLYEYAGSGQPLTYQKLRDKLENENFNSIVLIRLGEINKYFSDIEDLNYAKEKIKADFHARLGFSSSLWKKLTKEEKKRLGIPIDKESALSKKQEEYLGSSTEKWQKLSKRKKVKCIKKFKYHSLGIIQLGSMTLAIVASINFLISYLFGGNCIIFRTFSLLFFLITVLTWYVCLFKYKPKSNNSKDKRQICSSYPPQIIKMIMDTKGDNAKNEEEKKNKRIDEEIINAFADKWFRGTPPSPKNLYNIAKANEGCKIFEYNKLNLKIDKI